MLPVLTLLWLLASGNAVALEHDLEVQEMLKEVEQKRSSYRQEIKDLVNQDMLNIVNSFKKQSIELNAHTCSKTDPNDLTAVNLKSDPKYLIFISFSMPKETLKALYDSANDNNGVLLLRGLKNGSFKETAQYLKLLGIGVQIDPMAFKKYKIARVPTILLINNDQFKAISGNISFQYAKEKLLEHGS